MRDANFNEDVKQLYHDWFNNNEETKRKYLYTTYKAVEESEFVNGLGVKW